MLTVVAFIVALGLLIAIHEYGHYRVAVACGVKVLRFSVGMGKPLWTWRRPGSETEYVIAMLPLGGYVRMLDEREGNVPAHEAHRAFNRQPLRKRAAIVAAGPLANLLLAVLLYSVVNWVGVEQPKAVVAAPAAGTLAHQAGLQGGEWVQSVQRGDGAALAINSFEDLRWQLTQAALNGQDARLFWTDAQGLRTGQGVMALAGLQGQELNQDMLVRMGVGAPWTPALVSDVMAGMPAQQAGLQAGDTVQSVDGVGMHDGAQLRAVIRQADTSAGAAPQVWVVERGGALLRLQVQPEAAQDNGESIARIGAYIGGAPDMVTVRKGAFDGLRQAVVRTWEVSALSVQMMGKMLLGEASLKNLSGPLTIADYAGKSASMGWVQYLLFLALISVSLGVLNLLPLPVLDGGHLMYYLWEAITGKPVNDVWMERFQRVGISLLLVMMSIAFFNDISRIWG